MKQVEVLDHVTDNDFILKLRTRDGQDEIFLGKITPEATLKKTFDIVQARIDKPSTNGFRTDLGGGDRLFVPVLELSINKIYDELAGLSFTNPSLNDLYIALAQQIIKFRLDETGSVIESEAMIMGENGDSHVAAAVPYNPAKPRELVFDRPFLLFVRETNAKAPYLVMWIANDELMEASQK